MSEKCGNLQSKKTPVFTDYDREQALYYYTLLRSDTLQLRVMAETLVQRITALDNYTEIIQKHLKIPG